MSKIKIWVAASLLTILAAVSAYGQGNSPTLGRVNVPFKFVVGKKVMPAGKYVILRQNLTTPVLLVRNADTDAKAQVFVVERLARREDSPARTAKVVFNAVGDQKILSEFWPSGTEDGYLLQVTKEEHKHEIVEAD